MPTDCSCCICSLLFKYNFIIPTCTEVCSSKFFNLFILFIRFMYQFFFSELYYRYHPFFLAFVDMLHRMQYSSGKSVTLSFLKQKSCILINIFLQGGKANQMQRDNFSPPRMLGEWVRVTVLETMKHNNLKKGKAEFSFSFLV